MSNMTRNLLFCGSPKKPGKLVVMKMPLEFLATCHEHVVHDEIQEAAWCFPPTGFGGDLDVHLEHRLLALQAACVHH